MQYHRWGIRLVDSNGIKQYAIILGGTRIIFAGLGRGPTTWETQKSARRTLRMDKAAYGPEWRLRQMHGMTATEVKMNIEITEA